MKKYIAILEDEHIVRIGDKPCLHCFNGLMNDYFIPVKERKAGKWKRKTVDDRFNADWICTECGYKVMTDIVDFNYCPSCGADMRGDDDGKN